MSRGFGTWGFRIRHVQSAGLAEDTGPGDAVVCIPEDLDALPVWNETPRHLWTLFILRPELNYFCPESPPTQPVPDHAIVASINDA